jgi:hypothetical protein
VSGDDFERRLVGALLRAVELRHEVIDILYGSPSRSDAVVSLSRLLRVEPAVADGVIDQSLRRFIAAERAALLDRLKESEGSPLEAE